MSLDWLVLVPTPMEREALFIDDQLHSAVIQLCGFGPIIAAARTAELICRHQPRNVLLVGIAGGFTGDIPIGSACVFEKVACYGIGVGSGLGFQSAEQMGWNQWRSDQTCVGDAIDLHVPDTIHSVQPLLLSACSASADTDEANLRFQMIQASAEDMEGFAVAAACRLAGISTTIVRGISNRVGDRNHADWRSRESLLAAGKLVLDIIGNGSL